MELNYCKITGEDKYDLTKNSDYFSNDGTLISVYNEANREVGRVQISYNHIIMIESYGESPGIGTLILEHLFETKKTLRGESREEAIEFWKKVGAKFKDEDLEDDYPAFTLTKENFENRTKHTK